jgi:MFS family permease
MGLTQGLLATLVADASPVVLRGTAFGIFNLASGVATLVASVIAGALWDAFGSEGTFAGGAVFTVVALIGLFVARHRLPNNVAKVPNTL